MSKVCLQNKAREVNENNSLLWTLKFGFKRRHNKLTKTTTVVFNSAFGRHRHWLRLKKRRRGRVACGTIRLVIVLVLISAYVCWMLSLVTKNQGLSKNNVLKGEVGGSEQIDYVRGGWVVLTGYYEFMTAASVYLALNPRLYWESFCYHQRL